MQILALKLNGCFLQVPKPNKLLAFSAPDVQKTNSSWKALNPKEFFLITHSYYKLIPIGAGRQREKRAIALIKENLKNCQ